MRNVGCFLLLFLVPAALFLWGGPQEPELWTDIKHPVKFGRLSVEDGLSQSSVLCIFQDSRGFMWFGTEDGLNKYDGYTITSFRPEPGNPHSLSHNVIFALYEDSGGTFWIGANGGGINVYHPDTERFSHYRLNPDVPAGLPSDSISCIFEDSRGNIWFGTDGGVIRTRKRTGDEDELPPVFHHYQHMPGDPNSLSSDYVNVIYEDRRGTLWFGTEEGAGGLCKLGNVSGDPEAQPVFITIPVPPGDPAYAGLVNVMSINEDHHGNLWVGAQDGLFRMDQETGAFRRIPVTPGGEQGVSHPYIRRIYKDRAGVLWFGTDGGGLDKMIPADTKQGAPRFMHYRHDPNRPGGLSGNGIQEIFEDRSGVLWIGVYRGGVNKLVMRAGKGFNREKEPFAHYHVIPNVPNSLSHNAVNAICEDGDGVLWVGTDGGGLNKITRAAGNDKSERLVFRRYGHQKNTPDSLTDSIITALCLDHLGQLWIGTFTGGLNRRLPADGAGRERFAHYKNEPGNPKSLSNNFVMTLYEDRSGALWAGTIHGGLNRFDRAAGEFTRFQHDPANPAGLSNDNIFAIYEDSRGNLWVGTISGLNRRMKPTAANNTDREWRCYVSDPEDPHSLSNHFIRVIYEDRSGRLWIGTNGGGLNRWIPGDTANGPVTFAHYRAADGLPGNVVLGILEDEQGNLWISTTKGLSKFNPDTGIFKNYDIRDGLQGNEFNRGAFFKNKNGEMFFGGINGFNIFHPVKLWENREVPPIALTGFRLFNRPVPIGKMPDKRTLLKTCITETNELTISYRDSVVSFQFSALHYVNPSKNRYAYRMEGLEEHWNEVGNRNFAVYTTLPPGEYVFRVRGSNNDGVWNETGVSLNLTVTPPFWKTWWFYGLMFLIAIFTVLGIHLYRVRQIVTKIHKKYAKTAIEPKKAESYLKTLLHYMKLSKPYRDHHITLHKLAKQVAIPHHYLSQVINDKVGKIFFDFINGYRIEEALKKMADPKECKKTIHQVADEVGFNSQSAFNRAFKKHTDKTPSEYVTRCRVEEAARILNDPKHKKKSLKQVADDVGFSSISAFNRAFKKIHDQTPAQYRKKRKAKDEG